MQALASIVASADLRVIAVVGTSKNAGKTTTLNRILAHGRTVFGPIGLVSIGVDGEEADFWLGHPKPRIQVLPGDRFATAEEALAAATAEVAVGLRTGRWSPLGELVIATVTSPGAVLLAGVRCGEDLAVLVDGLRKAGAAKVVIDGAYQRTMAASPDVSDGVVVATGAVLGASVEEVASRTEAFVARLRLPTMLPADAALLARAVAEDVPWLADDAGMRPYPQAGETAFGTPAALAATLPSGESSLAVPGVLTDSLVDALAGLRGRWVRLLVADATRVFASWERVNRFLAGGGRVLVERPVRVLAITVNPAGIVGPDLPAEAMAEAIAARVAGVPVLTGASDWAPTSKHGSMRGSG